MERRYTTRATRAAAEMRRSWDYLPQEIQAMTLKTVAAQDSPLRYYRRHFHSHGIGTKELAEQLSVRYRKWLAFHKRTTLSKFASVSKQWQYFFERINFEHLFLHQDDVLEFGNMIQRQPHRKAFVKWIWLRLELAEYSCENCLTAESPDEIRENNAIFTKAVYQLFYVLSAWTPDGCHREGITLDLSAHSPSDAAHFARELNFRIADNYFEAFRPLDMTKRVRRMFDSERHSWKKGKLSLARRSSSERDGILARVFGDFQGLRLDLRIKAARKDIPGRPQGHRGLPKIPFIKSFVIRRQFYRHFSAPKALTPLIDAMPQLETFRYESWDNPIRSTQILRNLQTQILFKDIIRRKGTLKAVSIHGSTSQAYHRNSTMYNPSTLMPLDTSGLIRLGEVLAETTQNLQAIHGARNVEAEGFFRHFWPYDPVDGTPIIRTPIQLETLPTWENLTHLSLTSTRLNPRDINWLLMAAGSAAQRMPALRVMELWNYDLANRGIFRYASNKALRESQRPEIEIMISWWVGGPPFESTIPPLKLLSKETYQRWQEVARRHCNDRVNLTVEVEYMKDEDWEGSVIQQLWMSKGILTHVSYDEMETVERWDVPT